MKDRFYLACLRDTVRSNMAFHFKDGKGYSSNIDKAHVYTLLEAQKAWECGRSIDLPVSADNVDAQVVYHVDHQNVPGAMTIEPGCRQYVGFAEGRWDGNDLYWLCDGALPTTDFSKATVYQEPQTHSSGVIWLLFDMRNNVKRPTFDIGRLNRRVMIQGAGLRMPTWLKRQKRRRPTEKTRWNCPKCGKISWQDNPYDFEGCRDYFCEGSTS